ncbi:MAG: flagellar motor switch protein FliG [Hyphomicrobiaceae bacterium]|nr:flagellar motor switch protein FliG [Hyphomicrobiaceae bacterium]
MTTKAQAARADPEPQSLTGVEKVTVLLLALGRPKATQLLKRMDADEIKLIARAADRLPVVSAADLAHLVEEFAGKFSGGVSFVGTPGEVKDLLADVMAEEDFAGMQAGAEPGDEPVWRKVARLEDDVIRNYLLREHPQTVAVILSRLDPAQAARLIGSLPADLRNTLLTRMLCVKAIAPDALDALEQTMREDLIALPPPGSGTHTVIAGILNRLDKAQLDAALRHLSELRPVEVAGLRARLFAFEDLGTLPPKALMLLSSQVPVERLVLALRGTALDLQSAVLGGLPARARRMVEQELQSESDASAREIAEARRSIVDAVLALMAQGQIELPAAEARTQAG